MNSATRLSDAISPEMRRRLHVGQRAYARLIEDPAALALPHPMRARIIQCAEPQDMLTLNTGEYAVVVEQELAKLTPTQQILRTLAAVGSAEFMHAAATFSTGEDGGANAGILGGTFHQLRYALCGGAHYAFDDEVDRLLRQTRMDLTVPVEMIRLPHPIVFFEFGRTRRLDGVHDLHNATSGDHPFEGAYVTMTTSESGQRAMEITLTGAPKERIGDDHILWLTLDVNSGGTLGEAIDRYLDRNMISDPYIERTPAQRVAEVDRLRKSAQRVREQIALVTKAIFYTTMKSFRSQVVDERTPALRRERAAPQGALREAATRKRLLARSEIVVLPPTPGDGDVQAQRDERSGRQLGVHWREGYMRAVAYGPRHSLRRPHWFLPVLVNAHLWKPGDPLPARRPHRMKVRQPPKPSALAPAAGQEGVDGETPLQADPGGTTHDGSPPSAALAA